MMTTTKAKMRKLTPRRKKHIKMRKNLKQPPPKIQRKNKKVLQTMQIVDCN